MKKNENKEVIILTEPPASQQTSVDFTYVDCLRISESTVLSYLQLIPPEAVEVGPEKSAIPST